MKKGVNVPAIVTSAVAVCLVAIVAVLAIKARSGSKIEEAEPQSYGYENSITTETTTAPEETMTTAPVTFAGETESDTADTAVTSFTNFITTVRQAVTRTITTTTKKTTIKTDTGSTMKVVVEDNVTVPVIENATKSAAATVGTTVATSTLPKDMYFSGLYSLGYDVIGPKEFIYNDDTSDTCTQRNFGYNSLYDAGAKLIDFSIETTKIDFTYNNKKYRLQLWKGQYISGDIGTVGGEVGLYVRYPGKSYVGSHYDCADEEDWLQMEMTVLWDENGDGNYTAQLTRKYATHWWETGYVDGQLRDESSSNELKILSRITFQTEEQATLCVDAMVKDGFKQVSTFDPTKSDTVKQYGKDVIYVWHQVR